MLRWGWEIKQEENLGSLASVSTATSKERWHDEGRRAPSKLCESAFQKFVSQGTSPPLLCGGSN